jgi:hypothetical protein
VFDYFNADRRIAVAASIAHLVPLLLFVLAFFALNLSAKDEESWVVVLSLPFVC